MEIDLRDMTDDRVHDLAVRLNEQLGRWVRALPDIGHRIAE